MMALEVALSCLPSLLQVLLDRIIPWNLKDLPRTRVFDASLFERLKTTLLTLIAVFNDAQEKQMTIPSLKEWVDNLQDALYQAEELLDELESLALQYSLEQESHVSSSGEWSSTSILNQVDEKLKPMLAKMIPKIEDTVSRLEDIAKHKDVLGLKESAAWKPSPRLPTTSLVYQAEVRGRKKDQDMIKKELLPPKHTNGEELLPPKHTNGEELPILAIVGTGGVGKTTLAQLLYNDKQVKSHFTRRAWVHVPEKFDVYQITRTIYESITWQSWTSTNLDVLQVMLKQELEKAKLLLVLDDVWNESYITWDFMINLLKAAMKGSRIIVTTRNQGVASTMRATVTYPLCGLSEDDCQAVLFNHAFRKESRGVYPELEEIGERIAKRCNGLPLAAKTLGSLLHSQLDIREWVKILNSKIWDLPADKSNILPSLAVSYYYLPLHLKQCFAYCSIFPKDHHYKVEELVPLWMAQGFLQQPRNERSMESVGHEYFHELVSRSFFQRVQNGTCFVMHHLVNELAQFASGEYCCKFEECKARYISPKTRHFSYVKDQFDVSEKFQALREVKFLRTFLPLSQPSTNRIRYLNKDIADLLLESKYLRVLSLSEYPVDLGHNAFSKLGRLRYLDFSRSKINTLPSSICCLYMLQSLLLVRCSNLIKLPENMRELISLRRLDVTGTELKKMPPDFGKLKKLQMLSTFVVSMDSSASNISELGQLSELYGKLSITELQNIKDVADAKSAKLDGKENIRELVFEWGKARTFNASNQTNVLQMLRPNENIKKIVIKMYGGMRLPNWLGLSSFSKMASLSLKDCYNCTSLALLQHLPSLEELEVGGMEKLETVGINSTLPSLKKLSFRKMPKLETWSSFTLESRDFPSLQKLTILACEKLKGSLPNYLPSLKSLHIEECLLLQFPDIPSDIVYPELVSANIFKSFDSMTDFPLGIFNKLESLQICNCDQLESLSSRRYSNPNLTPETRRNDILVHFPSVKTVIIDKCLSFGPRIGITGS